MGRPRGKGKKTMEAASNEVEDGSGSEEAAAARPKRRLRPQNPRRKDDAEDAEVDTAKSEENGVDDTTLEPVAPRPGKSSLAEAGSKKKKKRRRHRLTKRSSDESAREEEDDDVDVARAKSKESKQNGFRQVGSRRKSTPRRAAEAGVQCKRYYS